MTTSNKATCIGAALAALLAATLAAQAGAQDTAVSAAAPVAAPTAAAPAAPNGPVSILPDPDPNAPQGQAPDTSIAVGELAAPGIDRLGLVSTARGGFGPDLWQGTDPAFLKQILPLFPARISSLAARRLAQNLLLSPGAPPDGEGGETLDAATLLSARVQALMALGDWVDAVALIELVPADQMNDGLRRIHADAELASDHVQAACGAAQAAQQSSSEVYWQELQVFCQLSTGQGSAATLGLDVLREQKLDDPAFLWAVDVLQGGRKPAPASVTTLSPLTFAMIRKAGVLLPPALAPALAKASDPTTMALVASIPTTDEGLPGDKPLTDPARRERQRKAIEARIVLAERAVAAGSLNPEVLRTLYRGIDLKQDTDLPLLTKVAPEDIRGRALLYQSALLQTVPTARAEVITRAVELARLDGGDKGPDLVVVGHTYAAMLGEMEASAEMVWFAGTAARALLAAGETPKAKVWLDLVHSMSRNSLEAGAVADSLWPVERLLSPAEGRMPAGAVRSWIVTAPEVMRTAYRETLLNLFVAVGETVSPGDFPQALAESAADQDAPSVRPAVLNGLTLAARSKRVGEVAALSLIALGEDGPAHAGTGTLQKVIESLMAVGRDGDARALAVEVALIRGL
jgi:hypothetical protein